MNTHRFHLPAPLSPTTFNIGKYLQAHHWGKTRFAWRAHFSQKNLEFDLPAAEQLEFKHLFASLTAEFCPHATPLTYCINDQNWQQILMQIEDSLWILKPSLLNNGQHIKIFESIDQIAAHYSSSKRMGGEHVLQQYLYHPHLLKGHKYSIRMFVILTNYAGAYLYPNGYFNIALEPYQKLDYTDLRSHITNEHLHANTSNVVQIPTPARELFDPVYQQIKQIIQQILFGLRAQHPHAFQLDAVRRLAVFGFDFLVDEQMRAWVLEANHGPCFPMTETHALHALLYDEFWRVFTNNFVIPIADKSPASFSTYSPFENVLPY